MDAAGAVFQLLPKELIAAPGRPADDGPRNGFNCSRRSSLRHNFILGLLAEQRFNCSRRSSLRHGATSALTCRIRFQLLPKELIAARLARGRCRSGEPDQRFNCSRRSSLRHPSFMREFPFFMGVSTAPEGAHCGTNVIFFGPGGHAFQLLPKELIAAPPLWARQERDMRFNCSRRSSLRHCIFLPQIARTRVSTAPEGAHCGTSCKGRAGGSLLFQLLPKELIAARKIRDLEAWRDLFQLLPKELIAARRFERPCRKKRPFQLLPKELIAAPFAAPLVWQASSCFNCSRRSSLRHY